MNELPRHSVSVTGIVFRQDGRILAIQRQDDNRWVPPGGVLELDETPAVGITVQAGQLTGVYKNMRLGVVTLAFRCSIVGGHQERATDEAKKIRWLTVEEATRDMPEARAVRVTDAANSSSGSLPARAHDGTHLL